MRNLFVRMRFLGTAYHGWQVQSNALSVQEEFQNDVEQIFGSREQVTGCSRTDSGVHANMYCLVLRTENPISCFKLIAALNAKLPPDIGVYEIFEVPKDFHPRYSCKSKEYVYKIWNGNARNPFMEGRALYYHPKIDEEWMNKEAKAFLGTHDFTSLSGSKKIVNGNIRTVKNVEVKREGDLVTFTVEADGFLYNMVRIMVGTLLFIMSGNLEPGSIPSILEKRDRKAAGITAAPEGLYLNRVFYGGEIDEKKE